MLRIEYFEHASQLIETLTTIRKKVLELQTLIDLHRQEDPHDLRTHDLSISVGDSDEDEVDLTGCQAFIEIVEATQHALIKKEESVIKELEEIGVQA